MLDDSVPVPIWVSFLVASFIAVSLFRVASLFKRDPLLDAIPTVGFSDPILSYFTALRFVYDSHSMLKYGYEETRGLFKIATFLGWMVLASSPELIEDIRKAPDDVLSGPARFADLLQTKYTMNRLDPNDDYHTDVIRGKMTRNIAATFTEAHDELVKSLDVSIPVHGDDWVKIPVLETMQRVVCATTNRVFVGTPLCRDKDYQTLNLNYSANVLIFAIIIRMFPEPLKPFVSRMLSNIPSKVNQEREFIRPLVEERFSKMEQFGDDWDDKPNDMLMWLMSEAKGVERSLEGIARRLLIVNFVGIHTTSMAVTKALYHLLSYPEHIEPLRHEVETSVEEEGWTKAGIDKMHKIDSFLRESQRVDGTGNLSVHRVALRPFTFSNGVTVPTGTLIAIATAGLYTDENVYPNPEKFDGFRFAKLRGGDGDAMPVAGYQATSTSWDHLTFGYGRQACPGRFFAVNEIKAILAHILVTYDIKLEEGKQAPRSSQINGARIPGKANVMFRKRQR